MQPHTWDPQSKLYLPREKNYAPVIDGIRYMQTHPSHIGVMSAAAFSPPDLTNLDVWIDASDSDSVTPNGGDVAQIDDKSGNGNHLVQDTASEQPAYTTAGQNGLNTVTYDDAANQSLVKTDYVASTAMTVFCGGEAAGDGGGVGRMMAIGTAGSEIGLNMYTKTSNWWFWKPNNDTGIAFAAPSLYVCIFNSISDMDIRINGTETNTGINPDDDYDGGALAWGNSHDNGSNGFDGETFELVIYSDTKGATDIDSVEAYKADKWAITLS